MRLRVGMDLDGVIVNWHRCVLTLVNERRMSNYDYTWNGVSYQAPSLFDVDFESPYWDWLKAHLEPEEWDWIWGEGCHRTYADAEPYPGAVDFLRFLHQSADIVVLTARPTSTNKTTMDWWMRRVGFMPEGFNFFTSGQQKSNVRCDVYIDDSLDYANALAEGQPASTVFLFSRAWNEGQQTVEPNPGLVRIHTYTKMIEEIGRLR